MVTTEGGDVDTSRGGSKVTRWSNVSPTSSAVVWGDCRCNLRKQGHRLNAVL